MATDSLLLFASGLSGPVGAGPGLAWGRSVRQDFVAFWLKLSDKRGFQ